MLDGDTFKFKVKKIIGETNKAEAAVKSKLSSKLGGLMSSMKSKSKLGVQNSVTKSNPSDQPPPVVRSALDQSKEPSLEVDDEIKVENTKEESVSETP